MKTLIIMLSLISTLAFANDITPTKERSIDTFSYMGININSTIDEVETKGFTCSEDTHCVFKNKEKEITVSLSDQKVYQFESVNSFFEKTDAASCTSNIKELKSYFEEMYQVELRPMKFWIIFDNPSTLEGEIEFKDGNVRLQFICTAEFENYSVKQYYLKSKIEIKNFGARSLIKDFN
tara:strand:+ start:51 stop:587 length:537 start_codon:yes stop_codon:yes gene_type:complete